MQRRPCARRRFRVPQKSLKAGLVLVAALASRLVAGGLGVDAYLDQVRADNPTLKGSRAEDVALQLSAKQPLTAFSPQISGQVQDQNNQEVPLGATLFSPSDIQSLSWDTTLSEVLPTGTQVGVDYSGNQTRFQFPAAAAAFAQNPQFASFFPELNTYGQQVSVSVSQPLWRNFMAQEVDASVAKAAADSEASRAANRYQAQALLYQARQAYIDLVTLRQVTAIYQDSLERNKRILAWTRAKVADNLADRVDLLEGQASLSQVALNLAQNREDEAKAEAVFNALRGRDPGAPVEELEPLDVPDGLPAPKNDRADLKAAEAALEASDAMVRQVEQSFTPDVSVFADIGTAETNPEATAAMGQFQPNTIVGLKFTANLDYGLYRQVLAGARRARGYGEEQVLAKKLEIARDWSELARGFAGVTERLALARQLEDLEKAKADRERQRYNEGRTTDFQALRFQDDYKLSRVQTLELVARANALLAQALYYNGDDQPW